MPLALSLRILSDICAGLHAAQELKGPSGESLHVVHRDVSPPNVLVARSGAVKIIDFGVAVMPSSYAGEPLPLRLPSGTPDTRHMVLEIRRSGEAAVV